MIANKRGYLYGIIIAVDFQSQPICRLNKADMIRMIQTSTDVGRADTADFDIGWLGKLHIEYDDIQNPLQFSIDKYRF
jgi:hypothetical protein